MNLKAKRLVGAASALALLTTAALAQQFDFPPVQYGGPFGSVNGSSVPTGAAGGDLSGTYPSPSVVSYNGGTAFGTAAAATLGTSGATVPLLNGTNTWSGVQTLGTLTATTVINLASTATNGLSLFNTVDQTTNYERLRYYYSGNVANIRSENGGTGTLRDLQVGTQNFGFTIAASSGSTGVFRFSAGASGGGNDQTVFSGAFSAGSGANNVVRIGPTVAQTSTAGIDMLRLAPTVTSTGSGGCNLVNGLGGSSATTAEFNITCGGIPLFPNLTTGTNADTVCYKSDGTLLIQAAACTISSRRFKTEIKSYGLSLSAAIYKIPVVTFRLKDQARNPDPNSRVTQLGLIAEDIAKIFPLCALYEPDMKTPKSYRQECLIAALVKTAQEQHQANEGLARRVAILEHKH